MAPTTFQLIKLNSSTSGTSFVETARKLPASERPFYLGQCQHWIRAPHLSADALTGKGDTVQHWDYLMVTKASTSDSNSVPADLASSIEQAWSITAGVDDQQLASLPETKSQRAAASSPPLPHGWSPQDHSGLDAAEVPTDLEASLKLSSYPLGSKKESSSKPVILQNWVAEFGSRHPGPVDMFNLLSYLPDGRPQYFQFVAAFMESVGSKYGGEPVFLGAGGIDGWSSKANEKPEAGAEWADTALIHYPSIWHFAKMLDDPAYADVDRKFKQGAIRDNPLICCTEIDLK